MAEDQDKYEALIEKHAQREMAIKEITESRIKKEQNSTKQITVKIFPNTHKALTWKYDTHPNIGDLKSYSKVVLFSSV